jgi:hypothetical protein
MGPGLNAGIPTPGPHLVDYQKLSEDEDIIGHEAIYFAQ